MSKTMQAAAANAGSAHAGSAPDGPAPDGIPDDIARLLARWNDTAADYPDITAHELFERQVARDPSAVAVTLGGEKISYGELNGRANRLARTLRQSGVGADALVGVCMERTPDMVVALLAIWKAGGAYVPLDPAYPPERLAFMVDDARTVLLLVQDKYRGLFAGQAGRVIAVDAEWSRLAQASSEPLGASVAGAENLAYVIYTSGSTGKPKGAMITHSGLVNYLCWAIAAYGVEAGRSAPVHSSISFDLTVTSLFTPLMAGGSVELLPEDIGAQNLLAALLREGRRSLVKITPAHLELLNSQLTREQARGMTRAFVIGGENLLAENLALWRDLDPPTRLINEYGPTETVVGCCIHEVGLSDPRTGSVVIGKPIANTQLYVLDAAMRPLGPGAMGELYIGGAGVARGYLNRPELTAERFLPDRFSGKAGARLYKTGDLARWRNDGVLEYLGRTDHQVKIRGFRIELGEIEAALAAHAGVQTCAVVAREDEPGNRQLVGYVVEAARGAAPAEALRAFLAGRLPDYMVPAQFVTLDALPLTHNGKVDRNALPAPSAEMASSGAATGKGGAPRTETEKAVAAIWRELLKTDTVGIEDDFFDIGGTSLAATALVARLSATFGVTVRLASLFEQPTIAALAEVADLLVLTRRGPAKGAAAGAGDREEFTL